MQSKPSVSHSPIRITASHCFMIMSSNSNHHMSPLLCLHSLICKMGTVKGLTSQGCWGDSMSRVFERGCLAQSEHSVNVWHFYYYCFTIAVVVVIF